MGDRFMMNNRDMTDLPDGHSSRTGYGNRVDPIR